MQAAVQLFFNPLSGDYSLRRIARLREAFEQAGARVILAESSAAVAPVIDPDATHVCVAGGDGTVRHVVAAMAAGKSVLPVAQYPAGTINLLARELAYPARPQEFVARMLGKDPHRKNYAAAIHDSLFLCCASIGPDCHAVASVSPKLKRLVGRLAYGISFVTTLIRWPRPQLELVVGDKVHPCEAVYIAKGRYYAGPFAFAPRAALSDSKLHVVALKTARRRDFALFAVDLMLGRDPGERTGVISTTCTALEVRGAEGFPVQADGDIVAALPISVTASHKPIAFV